jgi:predicted component of type VI protein secretion system
VGKQGKFNRLGMNSILGSSIYSQHYQYRIEFSGLTQNEFSRIIHRSNLIVDLFEYLQINLSTLIRFKLSWKIKFSQGLKLTSHITQSRLGWDSWLGHQTNSITSVQMNQTAGSFLPRPVNEEAFHEPRRPED